jgi:hypothetical protein
MMVEYNIISTFEGAEVLDTLKNINQRLPKVQLDILINKWRNIQ